MILSFSSISVGGGPSDGTSVFGVCVSYKPGMAAPLLLLLLRLLLLVAAVVVDAISKEKWRATAKSFSEAVGGTHGGGAATRAWRREPVAGTRHTITEVFLGTSELSSL
jgi:hypothetical protein